MIEIVGVLFYPSSALDRVREPYLRQIQCQNIKSLQFVLEKQHLNPLIRAKFGYKPLFA